MRQKRKLKILLLLLIFFIIVLAVVYFYERLGGGRVIVSIIYERLEDIAIIKCNQRPLSPTECDAYSTGVYYSRQESKCVESSGCASSFPFNSLGECQAICQ